jgi:limonene-1,2-epoxide hydrolase
MSEAENVAMVESFWKALGARDFDGVGAFMAPNAHYVDVPVIGIDEGAYGPEQTAARLRLGLGSLHAYELHDGPVIASGRYVVTEHSETWTWEPGVSVRLPFTSVMEVEDGLVTRWWDYLDLQTLMGAAPAWWVEKVAAGYK